ncbi:DNA-(apurinic or apyrimidinic site) endonuclease 2-like [Physella acuta]|uniref:DNA-(apurinic or apyrimidinic site) endonuclease 2-like n=1 Tax=Physella acuta TaxID=109671 RepID=UPI0027DC53B4|nr:DNA-(apurinic or apyrimidinic site) endonuclease 2-like [Physella acuta]
MRILTWNINGIRASKGKSNIKNLLDSLDSDIICLQETKVTRDMLDEPTAIADGYESYFGYSRKKTGYSGTANYCRKRAAPTKAEEGLSGRLPNHTDTSVGYYGDTDNYSDDVLEALDAEGRCVITLHRIRLPNKEEKEVAIINVYVPRAGEKEERRIYKLKFLSLLQSRAEALLRQKIHVMVVGDLNLIHRKIDNCEADDDEDFLRRSSRIWMNEMLVNSERDPDLPAIDGYLKEISLPGLEGGHFSDIFRRLHPNQENAYTNWYTNCDHRKTNYGRRLDYILIDKDLAQYATSCEIMADVESSDHCPVRVTLNCDPLPSSICPQHCSKFLPEFKGQQQKLSLFFTKKEKLDPKTEIVLDSSPDLSPASSQECCSQSNSQPSLLKPGSNLSFSQSKEVNQKSNSLKRQNPNKNTISKKQKTKSETDSKQVSLTSFFGKPTTTNGYKKDADLSDNLLNKANTDTGANSSCVTENSTKVKKSVSLPSQISLDPAKSAASTTSSTNAWKSLLTGPAPPPLCPGHNEPCVLKTVTKKGPNKNKQFYVCCRPDGAPGNPEFRCNYFRWLSDKNKKKS